MTTTFIDLSEDAFDAFFPLLTNHLNPHATWGSGDTGGCLFETYGPEFDFVRAQDPRSVWTFVDGDDGDQFIVSGCHFVNRIGYLISKTLLPEGVDVQVRLESFSDSDASE